MSHSPVVRFLEDFGGIPPDRPPVAIENFEAPAATVGAAGVADAALERAEQAEQARKQAYDEGYQAARESLEAEFAQRVNAAVEEARQSAEAARSADLASLSQALDTLLAGYDEFLDNLFDTALRPLVASALRNETLERFKSVLLELVDRRGLVVDLSGPEALAGEMADLLAARGFEARVSDNGEKELTARLESGVLRTHLGRIDRFVSSISDVDLADD